MASSRSTISTRSSPSSRNGAAACTGFAGAITPIGNPARPEARPPTLDQVIGTGDGTTAQFQLSKTYGASFAPWTRIVAKPVQGTVQIAVGGTLRTAATDYTLDAATGRITFLPGHIPTSRRRHHRRLRVRRPRPLRHRQARDRHPRRAPRRHPGHPDCRDPPGAHDMRQLPRACKPISTAAPPRSPGAGD